MELYTCFFNQHIKTHKTALFIKILQPHQEELYIRWINLSTKIHQIAFFMKIMQLKMGVPFTLQTQFIKTLLAVIFQTIQQIVLEEEYY
jgi:hypothetical protein